jgi:lysophospholipase L1-like esterase
MRRVVLQVLPALALVLSFGIGLPPAAASATSATPADTETPLCSPTPEALLIGDSLVARDSEAYESVLAGAGWDLTVLAEGGKTARWGLDRVEEQLALAPETSVVVVALGTNDTRIASASPEQDTALIRKYVAAVGDQRTLLWVNVALKPETPNLYRRYVREAQFNSALSQVDVESQNMQVLDWKSNVDYEQFLPDGVHYEPEAYPVRATWIADSTLRAMCEFVRSLGTRSISLSIQTASGVPVTGGSITWSTEGAVVKGPVGLTSRGVSRLPSTSAGRLQVSLRRGVLPGGVKVSGTWSVWQSGETSIALKVPDPPTPSTREVRVNVAGNRRVIGAKVRVNGLSGRAAVSGFTYTVNRVSSGSTATNGLFVARGFAMHDSPSATVEYSDHVIRLRAENVVVNREFTVVRLPSVPYLVLPIREIRADSGALVPVIARLHAPAGSGRDPESALSGYEVTIRPPTGAAQTCSGAILSATTDSQGRASLAVCATQSGTYRVAAAGAVTTAALNLLVRGAAPGSVTKVDAESPASGLIRVSWSPPDFIGGRDFPIRRYTITIKNAKELVRVKVVPGAGSLRRHFVFRGLASGGTYSVAVTAASKGGTSTPILVGVGVA